MHVGRKILVPKGRRAQLGTIAKEDGPRAALKPEVTVTTREVASPESPPAQINLDQLIAMLESKQLHQPKLSGLAKPSSAPTVRQVSQTSDAPSIKSVRGYLSGLSEIRVVLESTCGGLGHPSAAVALMERARELGFKGTFHLLHASNNDEKLASLLPEFQLGLATQKFGDIVAERFDESKPLPPVALTLASPDGHTLSRAEQTYSQRYNSKVFISLQPTAWQGPEFIEVNQQSKKLAFDTRAALVAGLETENTPPADALPRTPENVFFEELSQQSDAGALHYGVAYLSKDWTAEGGLAKHQVVSEMLAGLGHAQPHLKKPLFLITFDKSPKETALQVAMELKRRHNIPVETSYRLTAPANLSQLLEAHNNGVHVVALPPVGKAAFSFLTQKSSLPVIGEGAGIINEMVAKGIPHLHSGRSPKGIWTTATSGKGVEFHRFASRVLEEGSEHAPQRTAVLAKFLAKTAEGAAKPYFKELQEEFVGQTDKFAAAVLTAIENRRDADEK